MEGVCLILGGSHILYIYIHIMGMRRIAYVHIVYLTYRKYDREKHIQVHLFFHGIHKNPCPRPRTTRFWVWDSPACTTMQRWCGLQVAYVLRLWQMSKQLDGVINLYLRAWPELASLDLNDMDSRIAAKS